MGIKDIKKHSQKGDFLALKDGQAVKLRILSAEPLTNYQIFSNDINEGANVTEDFPLPAPLKARVQHIFAVYNLEAKVVQILKTSQTTAEKLLATYDAYNETWDFDFQFSRKGAGFSDTEYYVVVVPTTFDAAVLDGQPSPDLEKIFAISDDAQIARVIPGALKKAKEEAERKAEEKAAKQAAKNKKAGLPEAPAAKPAPAAKAPESAAPAPQEELGALEEDAPKPSPFTTIRVIHDLRTEADKKCPKCQLPREIKQGNIKAIDASTGLPWGQVKVAVCKPCNGMVVIEKVADPVAVAA